MIAAWMLYSVVISALVLVAAVPLERLVRAAGGATRRVWSGALLLAALLPVAGVVLKDSAAAVELDDALVVASPSAGVVMNGVDLLSVLDGALLAGWALLSTLLASALVGGLVATALRARRWRAGEIDGVPVLRSRDVGPAVIGVLRHRIVVPAWTASLDEAQRSMLLRHEQEHVKAGDPTLLLLTASLVAALPWNPLLWVMAARVRLAVETDCDRRVLRGSERELRGYAELLLSVGARRSRAAYGVGFSLGRPFLEQRIDRMTERGTRTTRAHTVLIVLGARGVLAAAWAVPQPVRAAKVGDTLRLYCPVDTSKVAAKVLYGLDWTS